VAANYRNDYLRVLRAKGVDAEREAARLGQDEVRSYLVMSSLPRLAEAGIILPLDGEGETDAATVRISPNLWKDIAPHRSAFAEAMRETGEHSRLALSTPPRPALVGGSVLEAEGLTKIYRGRKVVNDVALRLQQGEIVGLLGPNGAGKTTTFYMIVGLIQPLSGRILLDGEDITKLPMYERARRGIGYLSQEPSIFRKLSVEDNILAILETLPLSSAERSQRLEKLLDELSIKRLRKSKAYALSGGERRRLEITRALVTDPKFMMLDEPFAGVDPIAVHDIQTIVAGLRHRGIGVLISDHNVEQTLDIVDRAYIMFDGQVKVSGTVRDLVFDDTVADIYLGPTLTARLRERFSRNREEVVRS
jgi:lipopolysaccharide export system ATP-binding protein